MRKELVALILGLASLASARYVQAQTGGLQAAVNVALADKAPCLKRECFPWSKQVQTPTGVFFVTRCATSPRQQVELALAARMMARETSNLAWNELAVVAVASAFIHQPDFYYLVQTSRNGAIAELDRRLDKGEYGDTLRPGGAKQYLALAAKWFDGPQCVR